MWAGTERPPEYSDCVDVDLSFTPATNMLPIRRLGLEIGEEAEIHVAWLVWPELTVQRVLQRYSRLAEDRYRYTQDEFEAELTVDRQGLVSSTRGSGARSPLPAHAAYHRPLGDVQPGLSSGSLAFGANLAH